MSADTNATTSRRLIEETWNAGDLSYFDQVCAPDCVDHDLSTHEDIRGREANKERIREYRAALPDLRVTIEDIVAAGDRVVTRWRAEGTNDGAYQGNPPTHRRVEFTGMSIDRFSNDGKLLETWDQWDVSGLADQLGYSPTHA